MNWLISVVGLILVVFFVIVMVMVNSMSVVLLLMRFLLCSIVSVWCGNCFVRLVIVVVLVGESMVLRIVVVWDFMFSVCVVYDIVIVVVIISLILNMMMMCRF